MLLAAGYVFIDGIKRAGRGSQSGLMGQSSKGGGSTVAPDTGELLAMLWTHDRRAGQDVDIHLAWGSADARRWTPPVSTGIAGQICAPLALGGGRVFAAYVHRHHPPSLCAILSVRPDSA